MSPLTQDRRALERVAQLADVARLDHEVSLGDFALAGYHVFP